MNGRPVLDDVQRDANDRNWVDWTSRWTNGRLSTRKPDFATFGLMKPLRYTPAIAFLPLMAPYGIAAGFVSVTLAWRLQAAGIGTGVIAGLVAFSIWPNTWKVLWAPLVDMTLGLKRWHAIGTILTAGSLVLLGLLSPTLANYNWLAVLIVVSTVSSTLLAMAGDAMMAHVIEDDCRGIASGWAQAANLGGVGLGGGLALYLGQHVATTWAPGVATGLICLVCLLALPLVKLDERVERRLQLVVEMKGIVRELVLLLRSRRAVLAIILMLLPIGSGGAQNLWAAIAGDWRASADLVALVNGAVGGIASLVGALVGGWLCDRLDRPTAYCLFGLAVAAAAGAMALLPRAPSVFVTMTIVYAFALGACYAAYSAVVLEAIGREAAATKFQLLAAASNVPIALMTTWDGRLHDWRGATGMLVGEVVFCVAGVVLFAAIVLVNRRLRLPPSDGAA